MPTNNHHSDDKSISANRRIDWGFGGSSRSLGIDWGFGGSSRSLGNHKTETNAPAAPTSRYDPKAMNRIDNIDDLIENSSESSSDDYIDTVSRDIETEASSSGGAGIVGALALRYRRILAISSLVAIILGSSVAIFFAITSSDLEEGHDGGGGNVQLQVVQQTELEIAEQIIQVCSETSLDQDMTLCQEMCRSKICCFETTDEEYSCVDDVTMECAVYAGCEALVEGIMNDE